MRGRREDAFNEVFFLERLPGDASAAALLGAIGRSGNALDIARVREGEDALLLFDQVLDINLVFDILNFGAAVVAVFVADGKQLVFQNALEHVFVGKQLAVILDALFQLVVLVLQLLALESLQTFELHVEHDLRLNFRQVELCHQALFRVVVALADGLDDLVNVLLSNEQTLKHVLALECLFEIVLRAASDDLLLEGEVLVQHVAQRENLRLRLVIDQRQHRYAEGRLHLRLGKQAV